jgi:ABC-2 type transport system permease protein
MGAFFYGILLRWRQDIRNKGILITYYLVPLLFFGFVGMIFSSINPEAKDTLIQTMTIFAVTMGAFLGTPLPLVELYSGDIKKAYKVGGIPLWTGAVENMISAFVHLFLTCIIIYLTAPLIYEAKLPENGLLYFVSLAVFLLVCLSIGTVLGLLVKSATKLTMVSQILFLPSLMLSGIMFPTDLLPAALQKAGYIFPATWGLKLMTASGWDFLAFLPMLIYFSLAVFISSLRLSQLGKD